MRDRLSNGTYEHSISVAQFMCSLAEKIGVSPDDAVAAGLLHDICKAANHDEIIRIAEEYEIDINPVQRVAPGILHGAVGAEICRRELGVENEDVLDAIRWHTTGKANWSKLGALLYLADFAEPLRTHPEAEEARRILDEKGFDKAVRYVVEKKFKYISRLDNIHPATESFRHWVAAGPADA